MQYFKRRPYAEMSGSRSPLDETSVSPHVVSGTPSSVAKATAAFERELAATPPVSSTPSLTTPSDADPAQWARTAQDLLDGLAHVLGSHANPAVLAERVPDHGANSAPLVGPASPVRAGSVATVLLGLENDDRAESARCSLQAGDLADGNGHLMQASCLSVSPAVVDLPPGGSAEVRVSVHVPADAVPGVYTGLLRTVEPEPGLAVLQVCVAP